ncbi:YecA/YgfB family protein [Ideonella alba]|uniref:YecA family protein n=1 Tax=Ideonella alba TaxID=2824118 RepID=A0A940Y9J3_9BURK|nr:YecA family protein [Ideonella alba]MBQ0928856.1 YecA family protein [Ideonella alba]
MSSPSADPRLPLTDADMAELERRLDELPATLEPLDLGMSDGYLVGVLLQPQPVAEADWLRYVFDTDGRPVPPGVATEPIAALLRRRHAELNRAIHHRQWFDPWVFELDDEADPLETVLPWVAGFATALTHFPALTRIDSPELLEPLAVLYRSFDPEDLEDADDLLALVDELEPPADLADAVEALVSSSLLIADVSRPQQGQSASRAGARTPRRPGGSGGKPRSGPPRGRR